MTISAIKSETPLDLAGLDVEHLQLKDVVRSLPREVFLKNRSKAWTQVVINVLLVALGYISIAIAPWYLLPLAWIFTGTALTGFFVIAHDAGHRSFADRRWVNDLVGHVLLLPLLYPFHSWRIKHNHHHKHTNKMEEDNAWQPFRPEFYADQNSGFQQFYRLMRGNLWFMASIAHWLSVHFDLRNFKEKDRHYIKLSVGVVIAFALVMFPTLFITAGIGGVISFWLMPWLVYHFWMSTFTICHHTASDIPFREPELWNEAESQLFGTVHCDYPVWVEYLCHDINVHIPHHISTAIPSYNLRLADAALLDIWGDRLYRSKFSWQLMRDITTKCHLYDAENCYQPFPR